MDYIRVWPWRTFNFMDLTGNDHTNPRWQKFSEVTSEDLYDPYPKETITSTCWAIRRISV